MDVNKISNTINMCKQNILKFKRPQDTKPRKFFTYVDHDHNGNDRPWVEIVPHNKSTIIKMMVNMKKRPELNIVQKVDRFIHGNENELRRLFEEADMLTPQIERAIKNYRSTCSMQEWEPKKLKTTVAPTC